MTAMRMNILPRKVSLRSPVKYSLADNPASTSAINRNVIFTGGMPGSEFARSQKPVLTLTDSTDFKQLSSRLRQHQFDGCGLALTLLPRSQDRAAAFTGNRLTAEIALAGDEPVLVFFIPGHHFCRIGHDQALVLAKIVIVTIIIR